MLSLISTSFGRSADLILRFLDDLETTRRNTARTRNARRAAIHSFLRYVLERQPECALTCQRVLAIPVKKATRRLPGYLTETEFAHLNRPRRPDHN